MKSLIHGLHIERRNAPNARENRASPQGALTPAGSDHLLDYDERGRVPIMPRTKSGRGVGRQFDVYPLESFPPEQQAQIAEAVALPTPPAKWLNLGHAMIPSRAWYEWHWQRGVDPDKKRPPIPRGLRQAVYERDGYTCRHCDSTENLTLDHIHPFSHGGRDTLGNLQTLCRSCNSKKGARV